LYGAYATVTSICLVVQIVSGAMNSIINMRQCGPMPEPVLSITLRCILVALADTLEFGFLPFLQVGSVWVTSDAVKLGAFCDFQPLDADSSLTDAAAARAVAELPALVSMLSGTPRERLTPQGAEELWAPSGLFPDANYAVMAASMWPLRFKPDGRSRTHDFLRACGSGDATVAQLLETPLIEAYAGLRADLVHHWLRAQGDYERFKLARKVLSAAPPDLGGDASQGPLRARGRSAAGLFGRTSSGARLVQVSRSALPASIEGSISRKNHVEHVSAPH
jgi:hypothetical protein